MKRVVPKWKWSNSDLITLALVGLALLGVIFTLLRTAHGVGVSVSVDSNYYIGLARTLGDGDGFDWLIGRTPSILLNDSIRLGGASSADALSLGASAFWPPMYSVLLAAAGGFVSDPQDVAGPLNALAFGLTIFVAGQWMRIHVRSSLLVVMGCAAILFSVPLAYWASWALSETIFVLLATTALYFTDRFLKSRPPALSPLIVAAVFTALACITRYSGVVIICVVLPLIFLWSESDSHKKLKRAAFFLFISASPLLLWLIRNYVVTKTLAGGPNRATEYPVINLVGRGLSFIETWNPLVADVRAVILPIDVLTGRVLGSMITGVVLVALMMIVFWGFLWCSRAVARGKCSVPFMTVAGSYGMGHLAFTFVNASIANLYLDSRQLIPSFIPLTVLIVVLLDVWLRNRHRLDLPTTIARFTVLRCPKRILRLVPLILVAAFGIAVTYAGLVSMHDTYRASVSPEYGWNARIYNSQHIGRDALLLSDNRDNLTSGDLLVARSYFDLYLNDNKLIYYRDNCTQEDMYAQIYIRIVPMNRFSLPGIYKNYGFHILDFYPLDQGAMLDGTCIAITPLPMYDIKTIITHQGHRGALLWEVQFSPLGIGDERAQ